ncbi:hypothetical protein [Gymnodinialimonas ceratoperidinii]|nr:hypothetical protein [Gymnodinialimonas ceratoperidinii]
MSLAFWTLLALGLAIAIIFPVVLVAIVRTLNKSPDNNIDPN